jgi:pyruvate/2-oxoglutarate dehydrogenase complex dihydrolipoamide acyltransferase (E2) component
MSYTFKLPDLGEGLTEGEVARWLVQEGQQIAEDDPLVEIATDKTTVEIPSPAGGTVAGIHVAEGEIVPVGTVLVTITTDTVATPPRSSDAAPPNLPVAETSSHGRVRATPLVRRIAQELGVDLAAVQGSGRNGQVIEQDVRALAENDQPAGSGERREKVRGVRRAIVEHLTRSHREVPAVTFVEECDFSGIPLGQLVAVTAKAVAEMLASYPELNARLEQDEIVYLDRYDIGVAVQTAEGLLVPVLRDCGGKSIEQLHTEVQRLAEGARAGTLAPEELRDSTFTVTSAGKLGGLLVTPLVNHPEVAILGLHRIAPRPVARGKEIVIRPVGNVSVTFDHRVVDGARAAAFCLDVIAKLQQQAP